MTELKTRDHLEFTIIEAPEQFTHRNQNDLMARVLRSLEQGRTQLVLDLSLCTFMDSAAIGEVMGCYDSCQKAGGALKILGPVPGRIRRFIEHSGLNQILEIFDTETDALDSFRR